jgi:hypothetical protein
MTNENEFEVFVAPDVLVFVERRARVSTSQVFCVDFDGPKNIALHAAIYDPLTPLTTEAEVDAALAVAVAALPVRQRVAVAVARGVPSWCVWCIVFASLALAGLVWSLKH